MAKSFFKMLGDIVSTFNIWPSTDYRKNLSEYKNCYDKQSPYMFTYGESVLTDKLKAARQEYLNDEYEDGNKLNAIKFIKRCNELCVSFESPHTTGYVSLTVKDVETINYIKARNMQRITGGDVKKIATKLSNYINQL